MLPRAQRLSTAEFARAFEKSRVLRHSLLQLRVHQRESNEKDAGVVRAAFVVPKKVGKATLRNRLKRQVREQYRLLLQGESTQVAKRTQALKNCDLIWMIGGADQAASREEIEGGLRELIRRAGKFLEKTGDAEN